MGNSDKLIGLFFSVGLHLGLVLLLLLSNFAPPEPETKGYAIQAQIVDISNLSSKPPKPPTKKTEPKNSPPPVKKDPEPQPIKKPPPKKDPPKKDPPKKQPPKKEPPKKEVVKPKIDQKKREQQKKEQSDRQKKLEEIRKKRLAAEQKIKEQEEALKKLEADRDKKTETAPAEAAPQIGTTTAESELQSLRGQYVGAIKSSVTRQWARPPTARPGLKCQIKVNQIPGGAIIDVTIGSPCNADGVVKNSIINAVKKSDPLPFSGFESVFERRINFTFEYNGD
ncbi:cell envelope integrity protein TolA [Marinicella sp. W31]|uniref:cell envelope integrity protein TolA n=1 Tax=Marinicella sp. W31 TaxID=3023713 RepID=UPI003757FDB9